MTERYKQKTRIADEHEARPAENSQQNSATPTDAVEIAHAGPSDQRQKCDPGPEIAMNHEVEWCEPDGQAVANAANAIAQNKAAPIPQIIPTAVELKRLAESKCAPRSPLVPE